MPDYLLNLPRFPAYLCWIILSYTIINNISINTAYADLKILSAELQPQEEAYQLHAQIAYQLNTVVEEALRNGVALTFKVSFRVQSKRRFWWDKTLYYRSRIYILQYHALTQSFILRTPDNGLEQVFRELPTALQAMGELKDWPVLPKDTLSPGEIYQAGLQVKLHLSALPSLLQPQAYLSRDWYLQSKWFQWTLHP